MAATLTTLEEDGHAYRQPPENHAYRQPPGNHEAEMGLLGAILENNNAYDRVGDFLLPEHFFDPVHQRIYAACVQLITNQKQANPITLKNVFDGPEFERIGGHRYLAELAGASLTIINAESYGRLIHDLFRRRQLIEIGTDVVNRAYSYDPDDEARTQIEDAEQHLFNLSRGTSYEGGFASLAEVMARAITLATSAHDSDGPSGASTGLYRLDDLLGGLQKSDLIVLAARPSMGKTALATNIAFHVATQPDMITDEDGLQVQARSPIVAYFSLEMAAEQLATRILAENVPVDSDSIRQGKLNERDFRRLVQVSSELQGAPLYIDDTPALSVSAVRTRARRLERQLGGLGLVVVDYLQLLQPSSATRGQGRVQEISEITRGLKALAKQLNVPVLALSQLSRAVEQREDKRPQLADLRESGTIEQDADVVVFIFREEYYLERQEPVRRDAESVEDYNRRKQTWEDRRQKAEAQAELIVAKQRHGQTGSVKLRFHKQVTKFDNMETMPEQAGSSPQGESAVWP